MLQQIADAVGTPTYVYDADDIRERYQQLASALGPIPHRICYSVKANSNRAVLEVMQRLGAGADIVSGGELDRAIEAGFAANTIVFSGVGKTKLELSAALRTGVGLINVESAAELQALDRVACELGIAAHFGIRVNPDVATETHPYTQTGERGMKFGVPIGEVLPLARWARTRRHIELWSVGMHIGSQISNAAHYSEGIAKLMDLVKEIRSESLADLRSIDVGGGLGIRYTTELALDVSEFVAAVKPAVDGSGLTLLLQPGRYIVGNAGVLLARCLYRKKSGGREFVVVDAAMNDLIRPSLYGAVHGMRAVSGHGQDTAPLQTCDVVGPICETGDFLGIDVELPAVEAGSLLAILGAGAYGFVMSSTYNSRPRAAEVIVEGDRWAVVRSRETSADLVRGESSLLDPGLEWHTALTN